jgi:hypothetical protein
VRALLGHARNDTTQIYTKIRPPQLERAVAFYEAQAQQMLRTSASRRLVDPGSRTSRSVLKPGKKDINEIAVVAPTGFEPVFQPRSRFRLFPTPGSGRLVRR